MDRGFIIVRLELIALDLLKLVYKELCFLYERPLCPEAYFDHISNCGVSQSAHAAAVKARRNADQIVMCHISSRRSLDLTLNDGVCHLKEDIFHQSNPNSSSHSRRKDLYSFIFTVMQLNVRFGNKTDLE